MPCMPQVCHPFSGEKVITKATSVVHGKIGGVPIPFPLDNPDGCKNSGLKCPMKNGDEGQYKTAIFVKSVYPRVSQFNFVHACVLLQCGLHVASLFFCPSDAGPMRQYQILS